MSSRVVREETVIPEGLAEALREAAHYFVQGCDFFSATADGWTVSYDGTMESEAK